jgi:hypothetical protein
VDDWAGTLTASDAPATVSANPGVSWGLLTAAIALGTRPTLLLVVPV